MQKHIRKIERGDFHIKSLSSLPGWKMMLGYQFENLVLRNRKAIKEQLGIHPDELITDNPYFQHATTRQKGCQIDYLIQTKFHTLYVCEIKFRDSLIGPSIIKELQEKIDHMSKPRGFSCRPVLSQNHEIRPAFRWFISTTQDSVRNVFGLTLSW